MKKISSIVVGLSLLASSALYASETHTGNHMHEGKMQNHANANGMTNKNMNHGKIMMTQNDSMKSMSAYNNKMKVNGYEVTLSSMKPLTDGNNHMTIKLVKNGKAITNANVNITFSMPMMPGMEITENAKKSGDKYNSKVNFSMGGVWAYELNFKTSDGKMHTAKGSMNL